MASLHTAPLVRENYICRHCSSHSAISYELLHLFNFCPFKKVIFLKKCKFERKIRTMQSQVIETGVQLFSRINQREHNLTKLNLKLFKNGGPLSNEIIEVTGECSSDLLLDFMIRCILPKELNENWKSTGVVFVNSNHHISILRITHTIDSYLKSLNMKSRKSIVERALSLLTILNCYSAEQLELTFRNLEKMIQDRDNVNLLIVDDITSHFWIAKQKNPKLSLDFYAKTNFQILKDAVKNMNIVFIFARYQLGDLKKSVGLNIDYKIVGEKLESGQYQYNVIDYARKTSVTVPFTVQTFITFL